MRGAMGSQVQFSEFPEFSVQELHQATGGFHHMCVIGEGGFGKVYRAMVNCTPVAIKKLDQEGLQGEAEFSNELKLSRSIQHPCIVRLLGYTADGSTQCLVYELLTGGNLEERLKCKDSGVPPLSWVCRVKIAAQVSHALAYLHSMGIIHRDIKPANVFLDCNTNAKLGDIGLAALDGARAAGASRARVGSDGREAVGTWAYLAPEYKTEGRSSTATDTYAFGLLLLELTLVRDPLRIIAEGQAVLEDCSIPQAADPRGGAWDVRVAERLVKLGLWCCMHDPRQRPQVVAVHNELARMLLALQDSGVAPR